MRLVFNLLCSWAALRSFTPPEYFTCEPEAGRAAEPGPRVDACTSCGTSSCCCWEQRRADPAVASGDNPRLLALRRHGALLLFFYIAPIKSTKAPTLLDNLFSPRLRLLFRCLGEKSSRCRLNPRSSDGLKARVKSGPGTEVVLFQSSDATTQTNYCRSWTVCILQRGRPTRTTSNMAELWPFAGQSRLHAHAQATEVKSHRSEVKQWLWLVKTYFSVAKFQ